MITPLKPSTKDIPFYNTFDFETTRKGFVNGAGVYFMNSKGERQYEQFTSLDDFMDFILNEGEKNKPFRQLWAHNGGRFDWLLILEWLVENHPEIEWTAPKNSTGLVCVRIYPPKAKIMRGKRAGKYKWSIQLFDSLQVLPDSLKKLCVSFKVEIGKIDLGEIHPEDIYNSNPDLFWEYLKNDCVSLSQILYKAHQLFNTIVPIDKISPTTASVALRIWKAGFLKHEIYTPKNEKQLALEQGGYHGALVVCDIGQFVEDVYTYDQNSQFAYAMKDLILPISYTGVWTNKYQGKIGMYRGRYHQPSNTGPPIIFNIENKREYTGEGILTSIEIDYLLSMGGTFECIEGFRYSFTGRLFEGYVNTIYKIRMEAQENENTALNYIAKRLLTSLYGKFGQKPEGTTYKSVTDKEELKRLLRDKTKKISDEGDFIAITEPLPVEHRFPAISAFITAKARIMIHTVIRAHLNEFYYCDTDCVHLSVPMAPEFLGKEIGKFKLEYHGSVIYLGPKLYWKINTDDITSKGIPLPSKKSMLPDNIDRRNRVKRAFCDIITGDREYYKHHYSNAPTPIQVLLGRKKAARWIDYIRTMKCTASEIHHSQLPIDILDKVGPIMYELDDIPAPAPKETYHHENPFRGLLDALRDNGYISPYKNGYRQAEYKAIPFFMHRKHGLRIDEMTENLKTNYPWLGIETDNDLLDKIREYEIWRINHPG